MFVNNVFALTCYRLDAANGRPITTMAEWRAKLTVDTAYDAAGELAKIARGDSSGT